MLSRESNVCPKDSRVVKQPKGWSQGGVLTSWLSWVHSTAAVIETKVLPCAESGMYLQAPFLPILRASQDLVLVILMRWTRQTAS